MLKYYLCLFLILTLFKTFGQSTLIAKQGFENSGESWDLENLSTPPCSQEDDSWDYKTQLGTILPSEGGQFWGIQDLNGNCGSSGFEYLELSTVGIEDYRDVILSFDVQVVGYDNGDDMKYQIWLDGIAQPEVLFIEGGDNLSTDSWVRQEINIPNSALSVKLRISVKQNGSDIAGLDRIELSGKPITYCTEPFISEYLEGSSSSEHRNNFIELYNPNGTAIELDNYELVKFTGSNLNYASLRLSGTLKPYDTYLIEDEKEALEISADLSTNSSVMDFNGDDKIALLKDREILDLIGVIGDSVNFGKDVTLRRRSQVRSGNNEFDLQEWDLYGLEETRDLNAHSCYCQGDLPEIEVFGLGRTIPDGSSATSLLNNTYFNAWPVEIDTLIIRPFTVKNTGNAALEISGINITGNHSGRFSTLLPIPVALVPGDSISFEVTYNPVEDLVHTAEVEIHNNDPSEGLYNFKIQGEGTAHGSHPLMITQYYEGSANNKWIEITNVSQQKSPENTYYLALFWNEDSFHPLGIKPSRKKLIPAMDPGASISFCATLNVSAPAYALNGEEIKTSVCGFTGDDLVVISTSGEEDCWEDRTDMIGRAGNWGTDLSMVRNYGCRAKGPNTGFDPREWLVYPISDIDSAEPNTNQRIGSHFLGPTRWENGSWNNGIPDIHRMADMAGDYNTGVSGNLNTCSMHIQKGVTVTVSPGDDLNVVNDLIVEGELDIQHMGSLLVREDNGLLDNQGLIEVHKTASSLKPLDYTYWSSPVENASLEQVFEASPHNSFFVFSTQNFQDLDQDGLDDDHNAWVAVSGAMQVGRGYTSMAPDVTPFADRQDVTFQGNINNGQIGIPLDVQQGSHPNARHWNLVGNPYPSALDAEKIAMHPSNSGLLGGSFYFWTHETPAVTDVSPGEQSYSSDDYAIYTIGTGGVRSSPNGVEPTQFISSCQGFFVEALREGVLLLNNSMRASETNSHFFKGSPKETKSADKDLKIWLNLSNDKGAFSQVLIGFIEGATTGIDLRYDGPRFPSENYVSFYTLVDQHQLAITGFPPFTGHEIIKLGLTNRIRESITMKIGIDHTAGLREGQSVFLFDKRLSKVHQLNDGPYTFDMSGPGSNDDRFEIRFSDQAREDPLLLEKRDKLVWNLYDNYLSVWTSNREPIRRLEVFDLNGRKLKDISPGNETARVLWTGFPKRAIYILRARLEGATLLTKIIP